MLLCHDQDRGNVSLSSCAHKLSADLSRVQEGQDRDSVPGSPGATTAHRLGSHGIGRNSAAMAVKGVLGCSCHDPRMWTFSALTLTTCVHNKRRRGFFQEMAKASHQLRLCLVLLRSATRLALRAGIQSVGSRSHILPTPFGSLVEISCRARDGATGRARTCASGWPGQTTR